MNDNGEQAEILFLTLAEAERAYAALSNVLVLDDSRFWSRMLDKTRRSGRGELLIVVRNV